MVVICKRQKNQLFKRIKSVLQFSQFSRMSNGLGVHHISTYCLPLTSSPVFPPFVHPYHVSIDRRSPSLSLSLSLSLFLVLSRSLYRSLLLSLSLSNFLSFSHSQSLSRSLACCLFLALSRYRSLSLTIPPTLLPSMSVI